MVPRDILCATKLLDASKADIIQWAFHQRNYLFTQLTTDTHYCSRYQESMHGTEPPCWYIERILHEQTDLEPTFQFTLKDLTDRFAVIGIFEHYQESLSMFEKVNNIISK
jgi:hypothetical protein